MMRSPLFQLRFLLPPLGLVVFGCSFSVAQTPASSQNDSSGQTTKIAGAVVNVLDGSPLRNAHVFITDTRARAKPISFFAAEDGRFEFAGLKPGKYSLIAANSGFLSAAYDQHEQFSTAIVTGTGLDTEHLVLRLTPFAFLSGQVIDESGDPVRSAQVRLYRENREGGLNRIQAAATSQTDDRGSYEFDSLAPGNYFVAVEAIPWYAAHPPTVAPDGRSNTVVVPPSLDVCYPLTYYNGATEPEMAVPIPLKPGDRTRIDVQLNPVQALHVFFRVPQERQGFNPPVFQKRVFESEVFVQPAGIEPAGPGLFEATGIPPGRYVVRQNSAEDGEPQRLAELELSENGQQLGDSVGERMGKVRLSIQGPRGQVLPKQLFVVLQDARLRGEGRSPSSQGIVEFQNLAAGKYSILSFSQDSALFVSRTLVNGVESPGHDLTVPPGASLEVTAFLSNGVTDIEGFAKRGERGVAGVMLVLVPKDPASHQELIRRDQSDLDGSFVFRGVIPGTYTIIALENAWNTPWQKSDALARYLQHGQSVTIVEMMRGTVQLKDPIAVQPR